MAEKESGNEKKFKFVPPRPPVLQPNIEAILKKSKTPPPENPTDLPTSTPNTIAPVEKESIGSLPKTNNDEKLVPPKSIPIINRENPFAPKQGNKQELDKIEQTKNDKIDDNKNEKCNTEIPITPFVEDKELASPAVLDVSKQVEAVKLAETGEKNQHDMFNDKVDMSGGLMGWITKTVSESKILSDVAGKAKAGMETVITTLDPGMKPFLAETGVVEISIFNEDADVVAAAIDGFSKAGALVIARGIPVKDEFSPLVLGEDNASAACKLRADSAKRSKKTAEESAIIVMQPFLMKISEKYYSATKILLRHGSFETDAISQLLQVSDDVVDYLKKMSRMDAVDESQFTMGVSDAIQKMNGKKGSWDSAFAPYSSSQLLVFSFASIAQHFLEHLRHEI